MKSLAHKSRHQRCSICGRNAETGEQTDLGWTGPECRRKAAALPDLLASLGLSNFGVVVQVPAVRGDFGDVDYGHPYGELQKRLGTAGLRLERIGAVNWRAEPPVATFRIAVTRARQFNTAIKPFSQVQREFSDRLKAGSAARRLAEVN